MKIAIVLASFAASVVLVGCASSKSGDVYSRDEALREQTVRLATVESVRPVTIQGTRSGIGAAAGGVVGGVAGSGVGHGKGSTIAGVLGAVGGGVAGQALEEGTTRRGGVEIHRAPRQRRVARDRAGRDRQVSRRAEGPATDLGGVTRSFALILSA